MKETWAAYRAAFWAANPQPGDIPEEERKEHELHEAGALDDCLIALRRRQMLFQGHRWTCPNCSHHNWQDFGDLTAELTCEVCKHAKQAPIGIEWLFRPNEFLIE